MKVKKYGNEILVYGSQSYPLFRKTIMAEQDFEATKNKLETLIKQNKFKIIKKIESVNSNYARIYSKVKYEILFDDIE